MSDKDRRNPPDAPSQSPPQRERRRAADRGRAAPKNQAVGSVGRDDLGNAVWEWRVDVQRRRDDDPTIDLLQCLDVDGLAIEDEEQKPAKPGSFNPYNKPR